jgi:hypothetical protein
MSSKTPPRLPTYVTRPDSDGDIIDTDYIGPDEFNPVERFIDTFIYETAEAQSRHAPPPPNTIPAYPGRSTSGTGYTGLGAPFHHAGSQPEADYLGPRRKLRLLIAVVEGPRDCYSLIIHMPRRTLIGLTIVAMLFLTGKPGEVLDAIFNVLL